MDFMTECKKNSLRTWGRLAHQYEGPQVHLELPGAAETRAKGASSNSNILNKTWVDVFCLEISSSGFEIWI